MSNSAGLKAQDFLETAIGASFTQSPVIRVSLSTRLSDTHVALADEYLLVIFQLVLGMEMVRRCQPPEQRQNQIFLSPGVWHTGVRAARVCFQVATQACVVTYHQEEIISSCSGIERPGVLQARKPEHCRLALLFRVLAADACLQIW